MLPCRQIVDDGVVVAAEAEAQNENENENENDQGRKARRLPVRFRIAVSGEVFQRRPPTTPR